MVKFENDKSGTNNVIVTVYEESSTKRLPCPKNKIRDRNSNARRSYGYDRRAELLAQVHQLRNYVGTQPVHQNPIPTNPIPKTKKKRKLLGPLRKIRLSFGRIFGESKKRWRYESIETEGCGRRYRLCHPRKSSWDKFSKRFCRVLKQFSCFWKCNKFSRNEQELHQDMYARNENR